MSTADVNERLLTAFAGNCLEAIETCLSEGASPNLIWNGGAFLLHHCKNLEVMKLLLRSGADVKAKDTEGRTPLHYVLKDQRGLVFIEELLSAGVDVNESDNTSASTLHYAIKFKSGFNVLKKLLEHGADINVQDANGCSSLHYALEYNTDLDVFRQLLALGADLKVRSIDGLTLLHSSLLHRRGLPFVKELFNYELVNVEDCSGATPLHYAVRNNNDLDVLRELIHHGAIVNVKDKKGITPLHDAINLDNALLVHELLANGADVEGRNPSGEPPLFMALFRTHELESKSWEVMKELLNFGADIKSECLNVKTSPLLTICWYVSEDWAKKLVKLSVFGYYNVDDKIEELHDYLSSRSADELLIYLDECIHEMYEAKEYKINGNHSLTDFIVRRGGAIKPLYLFEKTAEIEQDISQKFPIYSDMILPDIKNCLLHGSLSNA